MFSVSSHRNTAINRQRRKNSTKKKYTPKGGQFRLTPLLPKEQEDVIHLAEELSKTVGINPDCVVKKMPSNISPTAVRATWKKFASAEERCAESNKFWLGVSATDISYEDILTPIDVSCIKIDPRVSFVLREAIRVINTIICLPFKVSSSVYFGPGVSQVSRDVTAGSSIYKVGWFRDSMIPNAHYDPSLFFSDDLVGWIKSRYSNTVTSDCIEQVPKDNLTNRCIGIGSTIGIASQHVVGDYLRRCLKRSGIDLDNLAEEHKFCAYQGSLPGSSLCTLDFSSASDTLSIGLISILMNSQWSSPTVRDVFRRMVNCRSTIYHCRSSTKDRVYEKFSAMGNCFTFELESLIFTALGRGIQRLMYTTYVNPTGFSGYLPVRAPTSFGDDLILDIHGLTDKHVEMIRDILSTFGLSLNVSKSFFHGSFKESCGADYRDGRYVRGFYFHKTQLDITDFIRCLNFFTIYHGLTLARLFNKYNIVESLFNKYRLSRICTSLPIMVNGLYGAYSVVPNCYIVINTLTEPGAEICYSLTYQKLIGEFKGFLHTEKRSYLSFVDYGRLEEDRFNPIYFAGDYLVSTSDREDAIYRSCPHIWVGSYDRGVLQQLAFEWTISEPYIWLKKKTHSLVARVTSFHRNGWELAPIITTLY